MAKYRHTTLPPPYLRRIWIDPDAARDLHAYPHCLPMFRSGEFELSFDRPITIIAGENGVGKSTLLEGIAVHAGFDESGGGPGYHAVDNARAIERGGGDLASVLKGSWLPKVGQGWFFRAESFFSVARYLDGSGSLTANFLSHSHGEGFVRFFQERCTRPGVFIFDVPGDGPRTTGYGDHRPWFWIAEHDATRGKLHVALSAPSRDAVDAFHREALAAGGIDNGPPGPRPLYHPGYYGAFVLDPDGHNIEAVYGNGG